MPVHAHKAQPNKGQASPLPSSFSATPGVDPLVQNAANLGPQSHEAMQFQKMADHQANRKQPSTIPTPNTTGIPDTLKSNIESLSGTSLDDVKVHRNSDRPAQLAAHAYAQGNQIYLGSGQEKHLAHEAWHVVQQKQNRVPVTIQKKGVGINDDPKLEREADVMGAKAMGMRSTPAMNLDKSSSQTSGQVAPVQQKVVQLASSAVLKLYEEVKDFTWELYERVELGKPLHVTRLRRLLKLVDRYINKVEGLNEEDTKGLSKVIDMHRVLEEWEEILEDHILGIAPKSTIVQPKGNILCSLYAAEAATEITEGVAFDKEKGAKMISKHKERMGGGTEQPFRSYFGSIGISLQLINKLAWVRAIRYSVKQKNPIALGVAFTSGKTKGNHWVYVSKVIGNEMYVRDQQNDQLLGIINMKTWTGKSLDGKFSYTVTQVGLSTRSKKDRDIIVGYYSWAPKMLLKGKAASASKDKKMGSSSKSSSSSSKSSSSGYGFSTSEQS